jgi:hypothetical protein
MPIQRELFERLHDEALANHKRIAEMARPLDPEQLVRRPRPGSWSVAEVLEHLCIADEVHAKPVATLIHRAHVDAGAPLREWTPTVIGKLIAGGLENPKPVGAPKVLRPGPTPRNGVVEDFLTRDRRFIQRMEEAASLDWRGLRLGPPVLPSLLQKILKINLGDVFNIAVVHVRRHMGQIERVVQATR